MKLDCLTGDTVVDFRLSTKRNVTIYTLKDFYAYFHSTYQTPVICEKNIKTLTGLNTKYTTVKSIIRAGIRRVRIIKLENGFNVTTTAEHKIGIRFYDFMAAKHLMEGDLIRICLKDNKIGFSIIESFSDWFEQPVYNVICAEPNNHFLANKIHVGGFEGEL